MSKSNHSQKTEHSSSYKEDEKFDEMGKSRVQKVHGGLKADAIYLCYQSWVLYATDREAIRHALTIRLNSVW